MYGLMHVAAKNALWVCQDDRCYPGRSDGNIIGIYRKHEGGTKLSESHRAKEYLLDEEMTMVFLFQNLCICFCVPAEQLGWSKGLCTDIIA